jgi:hypothetical protein
METLNEIPFALDEKALIHRLHIKPGTEDETVFLDLLEEAQSVAAPKVLYSEAYILEKGIDTVRIGDITFTSPALRLNLEVAERVFPFVVTCGYELDDLPLPANDFLQVFWLDTIKADLLGQAMRFFHEHIKRHYLIEKYSSMSPGSGDISVWPIEQQRLLFNLLGDVQAQIGVQLTDSFLMIPNKTVSGILFPTEKDFRTCQVCHRQDCPSRSAPFDPELWHMIHRE